MNTNSQQKDVRVLSRTDFNKMLAASLNAHSFRFLQQAVVNWLAVFPGDLGIQRYQAVSFIENGHPDQAIELLNHILKLDPEDTEAAVILENVLKTKSIPNPNPYRSFILGQVAPMGVIIPEWVRDLREARVAEKSQQDDKAEQLINGIRDNQSDEILVAITHIRILSKKPNLLTILQFAEIYRNRWPDCLAFKLWQADAKLKSGADLEGMNLLHQCVNYDITGQTSLGVFGAQNPYREMWPKNLDVVFDQPVPADVAVKLGWNQLGGSGSAPLEEKGAEISVSGIEEWIITSRIDVPPESLPAGIEEVRAGESFALEDQQRKGHTDKKDKKTKYKKEKSSDDYIKLAKDLKKPEIIHQDSRYPVYVILSSHQALVNTYGEKSAGVLEFEFGRIADAIQKRIGWEGIVFLPDLKTNAEKFNLPVQEHLDPWTIKLALVDLDKVLKRNGEMIGALLIVGGDDIIPFHRLPNPIKDTDTEVLSDNPYSTLDGNYFIPEWPTGRLPGEPGKDAGLLLAQLHRIYKSYEKPEIVNGIIRNVMKWLEGSNHTSAKENNGWRGNRNFGYTAAIWRRSSTAAFHPVGDGRDLLVSPPSMTGNLNSKKIADASIAYYNLHGLVDSADWYGQRDPTERRESPDYPVALSPNDIKKYLTSPKVIFSEACYGAHTVGKDDQTSLALKFISLGTRAFVGSTCISYGSINTPLIGGDLLGNRFWKMVKDGITVGEALMKAKIDLANEMNKRQGFLDAEDQKTILSFVLFGDPLFSKKQLSSKLKGIPHDMEQPEYQTVSDFEDNVEGEAIRNPHGELIAQAKQILSDYLPDLDDADSMISKEYFYSAKENAQSHGSGTTAPSVAKSSGRTVVTFRKQTQICSKNYTQFARMTMTPEGKMIKMVVSR